MDATLTKTSQTKQVAGYPVHDSRHQFVHALQPDGSNGPRHGSHHGHERNRVSQHYSTGSRGLSGVLQSRRGFGIHLRRSARCRSPTGAAQAKAYAALTKKMAEAGMALETQVSITASGDNPMAAMLAKAAKSDISTSITKIETGTLPAEAFDDPGGLQGENAEIAASPTASGNAALHLRCADFIYAARPGPCAPVARTRRGSRSDPRRPRPAPHGSRPRS